LNVGNGDFDFGCGFNSELLQLGCGLLIFCPIEFFSFTVSTAQVALEIFQSTLQLGCLSGSVHLANSILCSFGFQLGQDFLSVRCEVKLAQDFSGERFVNEPVGNIKANPTLPSEIIPLTAIVTFTAVA
jgi:hypothetical protein